MKKALIKEKKALSGKRDIAASYNQYKTYQGKQYTGMKIGRSHKWYYDKGTWVDKKITPEKWLINFEVTKRRAGNAPEGSGAPIGTEYHWYILAHQVVKKLDANKYSTVMNGVKYKLAHKRSNKENWNITDKTQRKHLIKILQDFIKELEEGPLEDYILSETGISKRKDAKETQKKIIKKKKEI